MSAVKYRSVTIKRCIAVSSLLTLPAYAGGTDISRLYSDGADRLIVSASSTIRFVPERALDDGRVRYRSVDGVSLLVGTQGRYVLDPLSSTPTRFVAGAIVGQNLLDQQLPESIEDKRPLTAAVHTPLLNALLLRESVQSGADAEVDDPTCPRQCDSTEAPLSDHFTAGPSIDEGITVDIRPESCQSYFREYVGIERGARIEDALAHAAHYANVTPTVRSFPLVDFIGQGEARVVRSRDLASASYAEPGALYDRLMRDGRDIETGLITPLLQDGFIERTELGSTTRLEASTAQTIVLEVIVQHGMTSDAQLTDIRRAASDLASTWGIALRVIEIP